MKLSSVTIENFRSIESQTIHFEPNCRVLVGINESGKTSILHALALLDPSRDFTTDDIRLASPDEDDPSESNVSFVFDLDPGELATAETALQSVALFSNNDVVIFKEVGSEKELTMHEYCQSNPRGGYDVDLIPGNTPRTYVYYWNAKYELLVTFYKPSQACPADYVLPSDKNRELRTISLIEESQLHPDIPREYLEQANMSDLSGLWGKKIIDTVKEKHPSVLFWEYDPSFILPPRIRTADFLADPTTPIPLRNMFELAEYSNIPEAFAQARSKTNSKAVSNLLNRVARRTTEHFKDVWNEYASLEFSLTENGEYIDIGIRDVHSTDFNFAQRSDGFKRFVTFLLLVSTKFKMEQLSDTLLLIDEPDVALHPSGSKYLRKELLKIAQGNYMVYSTHSIFMIDPVHLERHLIVTKPKEITAVNVVTPSNVRDEEVIYNALGTSIYESLKELNILFEGWYDKRMFEVALSRMPAPYKSVGEILRKVGHAHAMGVKNIQYVTPSLEMANKKIIIVTDADNPARESQELYRKNRGYGEWFRYDELLPTTQAKTGEDFLKSIAFKSAADALRSRHPGIPTFSDGDLEGAGNKLTFFESLLAKAGVNKEDKNKSLRDLKDQVFAELKSTSFTDEYYEMLKVLADKVDAI
jgi:predicted ATPase